MQSTAVQMKTSSPQDIKKQTSSTDNDDKVQAEFTDPFLQIIMSLLTQSLDQSTQPTDGTLGTAGADQLSELSALLQNSSAGMTALLNTMLNGGTEADTGLNSAGTESTATLLNSAGTANTATLLNLEDMAGTSTQAALNTLFGTQASTLPSVYSDQSGQSANLSDMLGLIGKSADGTGTIAISSDALAQITDLLGLSGKDELQSLLKNAGIEVISGESVSAQGGLSEAAVKAKQLLSDYLSQQNNQEDIDVDKLQSELSKTETATPFELSLKSVGNPTDVKTLDQITDAIKQNISLGKSEFAIKLKPESLGEITVKLVEEAGKTTLTITAANAQTAKLINSDINALREAVAPMNVEVRNAVVSTSETAGGSMQQFNMTGQQFAGQQFSGQQSSNPMTQIVSGQVDNQTPEDVYASSQAAQVSALSGKRLDSYI